MIQIENEKNSYIAIVSIVVFLGGFICFYPTFDRNEKMMGAPQSSPNGMFEVRRYRVRTVSSMLRPARGSDDDEGYVRLYEKKSGKMMEEAFCSSLNAIRIVWNDGSVGFSGPEGVVWKLPK